MFSSEDIKKRLSKDVNSIVKGIVSSMSVRPFAILLCGGYGRGEGAWWTDANGNVQPYNDYDFAVITDDPLPRTKYLEIRKRLAEQVGISWVDINFYSPQELLTLTPSIKNYDLIHASQIVYGEYDLKNEVALFDVSEIGDNDIDILYKTRMWTFLGSWSGVFRDLNFQEAMFFRNQMAKGVLAACDMLLVRDKKYTVLYSDRVNYICKNYSQDKVLCKLALWALKEKLRPTVSSLKKNDMEKLYWDAKNIFENAFKLTMPKRWKVYSNPSMTKYYYYFCTKFLLSNIFNKVLRHSKIVEQNRDLFLMQNYIFWANNRGNINKVYLNSAAKILKKWGYIEKNDLSWDDLRILVANARNSV